MKLLKQKLPFLLILIFVGIFVLLLKNIEHKFFLIDDNAHYYFPAYLYNWRSILSGHLPLVNFHQLSGVDHLGQGHTGVFYLPAYVAMAVSQFILSDLTQTMAMLAGFHLSLSCIGVYLLSGRWIKSKSTKILLALVWISFPYLVFTLRFWTIFGALFAYLPCVFLYFLKIKDDFSRKDFYWLLLFEVLLVSTGYVQWIVMVFLFQILFLIIDFFLDRNKKGLLLKRLHFVKVLFFNYVLLSLLTAPQVLPMLVAMKNGVYRNGTLPLKDYLIIYLDVVEFLLSQIFWFYEQRVFYLGTEAYFIGPPLFILLTGLFWFAYNHKNKYPTLLTFLLLSLVSLLLSTILNAFLYPIPVLNWFRFPYKYFAFFLFFFVCGLSVFVGIARSSKATSWLRAVLLISIVLNLGVILSKARLPEYFHIYIAPNDFQNPYDQIINNNYRIRSHLPNTQGVDRGYPYIVSNYATWFDLYHADGYATSQNKFTVESSALADYQESEMGFWEPKNLELLNNWSVGYIFTDSNSGLKETYVTVPTIEKIYDKDNVIVFKNTAAQPIVQGLDEHEDVDFFGDEIRINHPILSEPKKWQVNITPLVGYEFSANSQSAYSYDSKTLEVSSNDTTSLYTSIHIRSKALAFGFVLFLLGCGLIILDSVFSFRKVTVFKKKNG